MLCTERCKHPLDGFKGAFFQRCTNIYLNPAFWQTCTQDAARFCSINLAESGCGVPGDDGVEDIKDVREFEVCSHPRQLFGDVDGSRMVSEFECPHFVENLQL